MNLTRLLPIRFSFTSTKPQSTVHSALAMVTETFNRSPDAANAFPRWCFWALRKFCTSFNFAWSLSIYSLEEFRYPLSTCVKHPWLLSASASAMNLGSVFVSSISSLYWFSFARMSPRLGWSEQSLRAWRSSGPNPDLVHGRTPCDLVSM